MMKYPIGVQSFETLRSRGFVYVDKTALIYDLVQGHVFFLCRPRRFGKSLLVSTLKAYFEGRRDLFDGLAISRLEQDWERYPVITFDFNLGDKQLPGGLRGYLFSVIQREEERYGIRPAMDEGNDKPSNDVGLRFYNLISGLHRITGRQVVILVDEYDKPLLDLLETGRSEDRQQYDDHLNLLKYFFSTFKAADDHLRFVLLTGVTKFSQVSMFSGFNQPDDISFDNRYDTLLGITEDELYSYFELPIQQMAEANCWTVDETKARLKKHYDGYHFSNRLVDVYNPFSIINAFAKNDLGNYWFASGTPAYLVRLIAKNPETVMQFTNQQHTLDEFVNYKADTARPLPMLFQAGYLTIRSYDPEFKLCTLDYPNDEVKQGLMTLLANDYLQPEGQATAAWVQQLVKAFDAADLDLVQQLFTAFLADTPYQMRPKKQTELYFHYTFYLIMRLVSCYTVFTEHQNSQGRCDCTVETPEHIYIFEFKLDGSADEALEQIRERGYARPYAADPRQLHLIGATFSSETGTIGEWKNSNPNPNPNDNPNPKGNNI